MNFDFDKSKLSEKLPHDAMKKRFPFLKKVLNSTEPGRVKKMLYENITILWQLNFETNPNSSIFTVKNRG